jgi:hypothetical protein
MDLNMKTWFTPKSPIFVSLLTIIVAMVTLQTTNAQACACKGSVNVSVDGTGSATVTAAMLLTNESPTNCTGASTVQVMLTPTGSPIPGSPNVTCEHVGKTLYGKVTNGTNSCWSTIIVQDELKPTITCPSGPVSVSCTELVSYRPTVTDNCPSGLKLDFTEIVNDNSCSEGLPDNVIKQIVRTYTATDKSGNNSAPCTITLNVTTITLAQYNSFTAPAPYNEAPGDNDPLACDGDWLKLPNGHPDPYDKLPKRGTGLPTLGVGGPIITEVLEENCKLDVSFSDVVINAGCVTKYAREWKIIDWACTRRPHINKLQMIEVVDRVGPTIGVLSNLEYSTSPHECLGRVNFAAPTLSDACSPSDKLTFDINIYDMTGIPVGIIKHGQARTFSLPTGRYTAEYVAYDGCYNKSRRSITVVVSDKTPPVVVCKEFATIGITSDGNAWVPASSFDNGSHDECKMGDVLVRRMDTDNCGTCDLPTFNGFKLIGEYGSGPNKRYYYLSEHGVNPDVALRKARAYGGYAVSFGTLAERNAVNNMVKAIGPDIIYFIGYSDIDGDSKYTWEDPKDTIKMTVFDPSSLPFDPANYTYISADDNTLYEASALRIGRYVVEISDPCGWSAFAKFCCTDVNPTVPQVVSVRAIDAAGNFNDCMVNVIVQDKIGPTISCPKNEKVTCDFVYDPNNLRKDFGWPTYSDNCGGNLVVLRDSMNNVNSCRVGKIRRTWTVTDAGGRSSSCTQMITFSPNPSLEYTGPKENEWPRDTMILGCGNPNAANLSPDSLGRPKINNEACSLVAVEIPDDKVFNFNNQGSPACYKILRTWVVIDWCKFYPNKNADGVDYPRDITYNVNAWKRTQEIKIIDNIAPEIDPVAPSLSVNTFDATCEEGFVELRASADDICTRVLRNRYEIQTQSGQTIIVTGNGNTINASGTYPVGTHTITYIFEDNCGNLSRASQTFSIINKKAPNITLRNGLAINLGNDGGGRASAEIWASDFDLKSSHPCGYDVLLSFIPIRTQVIRGSQGQDSTILVGMPNRVYTCDSLGRRNVKLYAASLTPDNVLVTAEATTFIDVQDNGDYCNTTTVTINHNISGRVVTENNIEVEDIRVSLIGSEKNIMTDAQGNFGFEEVAAGGDYTVTPYKNDDVLNGISTLDIVMIQRYILKLASLNSPYKMVAADVNKDGKITSLDLVELRKVILGTNTSFTNNNSWRFADKNYTFSDANNAQGEAFPEVYPINNLNSNMVTDFVAIKVGDVNNSYSKANEVILNNRSLNTIGCYTDMQTCRSGSYMRLPIRVGDVMKISGFQAAWKYDVIDMKFKGVEPAALPMGEDNVSDYDGVVRVSWHSPNAIGLESDAVMFYLLFEAIHDVDLKSTFTLDPSSLAAEVYNSDVEVMKLQWENRDKEGYALYQNHPNPFKDQTVIGFDLPTQMMASFTFYDLSGKLLKVCEVAGQKGYNSLTVQKDELGSGLLYYTMQAGEYISTRKMIIIK